jgi:hypothetical protein
MTVAFDPFTFALALLIGILGIIAFRRQRVIILRIRDVDSSATQSAADDQEKTGWEFRIVIQNVGIPLHNIRLCIVFRPRGTGGNVTVPLYRYSALTNSLLADKDAEFARGMIGDFRLRTNWIGHEEFELLAALEDPIAQNARLCLYSEGCYLAKAWKIGVGLDSAKRRWNEMLDRLNPPSNSRINTKVAREPSLKPGNVLRHVPTLYGSVLQFTAAARTAKELRCGTSECPEVDYLVHRRRGSSLPAVISMTPASRGHDSFQTEPRAADSISPPRGQRRLHPQGLREHAGLLGGALGVAQPPTAVFRRRRKAFRPSPSTFGRTQSRRLCHNSMAVAYWAKALSVETEKLVQANRDAVGPLARRTGPVNAPTRHR